MEKIYKVITVDNERYELWKEKDVVRFIYWVNNVVNKCFRHIANQFMGTGFDNMEMVLDGQKIKIEKMVNRTNINIPKKYISMIDIVEKEGDEYWVSLKDCACIDSFDCKTIHEETQKEVLARLKEIRLVVETLDIEKLTKKEIIEFALNSKHCPNAQNCLEVGSKFWDRDGTLLAELLEKKGFKTTKNGETGEKAMVICEEVEIMTNGLTKAR